MDDDRPRLLSVRQTADVLGCSTKSVYRLSTAAG
jgi:predicted DNA-binding transcriptional regulator AlpA